MKLERSLHSKVARRIFVLFVLCALVPIVGLAVVSLVQVRRQLVQQSHDRLYETAKGKALAVFERLAFLETELELIASELTEEEGLVQGRWRRVLEPSDHAPRMKSLLYRTPAVTTLLYGTSSTSPELTETQVDHLEKGHTVLGLLRGASVTDVWMMHPVEGSSRTLLAYVDLDYLWAAEDLPAMAQLTVRDGEGDVVFTTVSRSPMIGGDTETFVSSTFELPLRFAFASEGWTVELSEPKDRVLAPAREFVEAFPFVVLLSFWVVLFLSVRQIRGSLDPLERLKEGTKRIGSREFDTEVEVSSGDEFEELADAFNTMGRKLGQQFRTLTTLSEIDRAVLSTLNSEEITRRLLTGIFETSGAVSARITLFGAESGVDGFRLVARRGEAVMREPIGTDVSPTELDLRSLAPDGVEAAQGHPGVGDFVIDTKAARSFVLPILVDDGVAAVVALGYGSAGALSDDEKELARQLADRFTVALRNARLVETIDRLSWGALVALARAIDAKSPWTAGHSERAAKIGVVIGRRMGLRPDELAVVHKGGLLHDIGKIGIPPSILDKAGKLTEEEREVMKEHPRLGARILQPIEAYAKFIPVVLQHHEWFDGSGYPDGVAGESISLYARIYSVADVYDALFADRPYRAGLSHAEVVEYIRERAGTQFDPEVVRAFLEAVASGAPEFHDRARHLHRLTGALATAPAFRDS